MMEQSGTEVAEILRRIEGRLDGLNARVGAIFDDTQAIQTLLVEMGQRPQDSRSGGGRE